MVQLVADQRRTQRARNDALDEGRQLVVGELVMEALRAVDEVGYVRYASVYRDFRETGDFARFLGEEGLAEEPEAAS